MAGLDLSSLGALTANVGSLLPSGSAIMENVLVGAAGSVVLKGLQAGGASSLDPLGLFPKAPGVAPVSPTNNPNALNGPTITASAFASLDPASKAALLAAGAHIVAG
jgi:hypothetical protein